MTNLVELILAFADFVEANTDRTRAGVFSFSVGLALVLVFAWLVFACLGLALAAIFLLLWRVLPIEAALLITAVCTVVLAGGTLWLAGRKAKA